MMTCGFCYLCVYNIAHRPPAAISQLTTTAKGDNVLVGYNEWAYVATATVLLGHDVEREMATRSIFAIN